MKTLKLSLLERQMLSASEMSALQGGRYCQCACYYRNVGGSSVENNSEANYASGADGLRSPQHTQDEQIIVDDPAGGKVYF